MSWRVTDLTSSEDGKLTPDLVRDFGRRRDNVEGTDAFTVQTGVLSETLADQRWDAASDEFPDSPGIPVQITAGETLVGAVEEGVVTLLQHHVGDLTPLFPGRIDTGWIMSAGVEKKDGTIWSGGKIAEQLIEGKTNGLGIVVFVGEGIDSDVPEDSKMVYPRGVREIDLLGSIENVEPTEEQGPKVVGAGTGNGLHADNAFLPDRGRVSC